MEEERALKTELLLRRGAEHGEPGLGIGLELGLTLTLTRTRILTLTLTLTLTLPLTLTLTLPLTRPQGLLANSRPALRSGQGGGGRSHRNCHAATGGCASVGDGGQSSHPTKATPPCEEE